MTGRQKTARLLAGGIVALATGLGQGGQWPDSEITLGVGGFEPRGEGGLWDVNGQIFTQEPQDFDDFTGSFRIGGPLNDYVMLDVGTSYYDSVESSQERFYTDGNGGAIVHDARLRLMPVTGDIRFLPFGRYREAGNKARGLRTVSPYIGFGAGAMLWNYRERGDFVDPGSLVIFYDELEARGVAFEYHGMAGIDVNVNPNLGFFVEGRISRADDDLSSDFTGFDEFDLSGSSISAGMRFRF